MDEFVVDTHALVWYLSRSERLGNDARNAFDDADNGRAFIHVPAIVLAEFYYLIQKHRIPIDFDETYQYLMAGGQFILTPFDPGDVLEFKHDHAVSEMHDRMIAGLARRLGCPLLSNDKQIVESGVVVVVW